MKTSQAIFLTIGLTMLGSLIGFDVGGTRIYLMEIVVLISAIWAAVDSSKMQLKRYKSGISYSPLVLFILIFLLWIVAFPWYLSMRYKIQNGTAILKEGVPEVSV